MGWLYETKGCTLFPDGNYESCCEEHDRAYRLQTKPRIEADRKLRECVRKKGHPNVAALMYYGLRIVGVFRWYWIKWMG